jgi:hypothetical protein
LNPVNAGNSVPVKFSLGGNRGLSIFAPGNPESARVDCRTLLRTSSMVAEYPGSSTLTYDTKLNQYQFNWKTAKNYRGCRRLYVGLADGSVHTALFNFG